MPPPGAPSPQRLPGRLETEFSALRQSTSLQPSKCVEGHDCRIVPSVRSLQLLPPRHLSWHLLSCELVPFHTDQSLPTALKLSRLAPLVAPVVLRLAGVPRLVDSASLCSRMEPLKFVPQLPPSRHLSSRLALLWGQSQIASVTSLVCIVLSPGALRSLSFGLLRHRILRHCARITLP